MTTFPGAPKLIKGAIVGVDKFNPLASVIVFQFNPDSMTRSLTPRVAENSGTGQQNDRGEVYRLKGPPEETISFKIEIDAADEDGSINPLSYTSGISPTLSALEMLYYPKSALVLGNDVLSNAGMLEIIPPEAPMTLFIWGPQRVLPVRITRLSITEQAFDSLLNPIRAEVDISMTVLSYYDLKMSNPGYSLFMIHQVMKEVQATSNVFNSVQNIGSSLNL